MAGILKRFKDIMAANINALLDKAEDPEKMVDQYIRDMESDLGKGKAETAAVMAEATRTKRELDNNEAEITKMGVYAEKALLAGNEDDARKFLEKKARLTADHEVLKQSADNAEANAARMREMHDKLESDIAKLNERKASIKAKVKAAKTQQKINELNEKVGSIDITDGMSAFDKMEAKADQMLDEANARAELDAPSEKDMTVEELAEKYDVGNEQEITDELEEMKKRLGL